MFKKIGIAGLITFSLSSCIGYKSAAPERMNVLKNTSEIKGNTKIPDKWIQHKERDSIEFSYQWMKELVSPELESLIQEGLDHNADIVISKEKLHQIELSMNIAGSNLYPSVNALANTSNNIVSGSHIGNLQIKSSWEIDLWGKNKSAQMSIISQYYSSAFQQKMLEQSIAAMIAKSYFLNIAGQYQEQKITQYITATDGLKNIYSIQNKIGIANSLDISNIEAEIILLNSYLEKVKNANSQSRRNLEILCGRYPEDLLKVNAEFSPLMQKVPSQFPLSILENRSDIMAWQFQIERSFYDVQEAKAARLPSINISAGFGAAETNVAGISNLFSNPLIRVGSGLTTPIFNGGKLKKNVEIKTSEQQQVIEQYSKSVLTAFGEVESALANLSSMDRQNSLQQDAILTLQKNIELTKKQIQVGNNNNLALLQKQRDLIIKEMNSIDLNLQQRVERVNLYMALGANGLDQ